MKDDLADAITHSLCDMAEKAYSHLSEENAANSVAILNEWTTDSDECVLTHHYLETIETISDLMMYSFVGDEGEFGYGTFSFNPNSELVD